jgi:tRNA pseudouridine55 synthase
MARRKPATTHGLAIVDKPTGVTSHDVVGMLRRRFGERQVGHAGTLDPDATGVLVVAVGMATRLLRFVEKTQKEYVGEVLLGAETNTLDAAGDVTATYDMSSVTIDQARAVAAAHLTGPIRQIPPMVSAIRVDGQRLHELARQGIEIEREPRDVVVDRFDISPTDDPLVLRIEVECSAGTYIRSLAADLGTLLGGGAHLRGLRRTRVGSFTISEAAGPDDCDLLPVATAVRSLAAVTVDAPVAALIANGRVLPAWDGAGPWAVFDESERLLAVYERFDAATRPAGDAPAPAEHRPTAKPAVVLPAPS